MKNEKNDSSDFSTRWRPDFRYVADKFIQIDLNNFKSTEPSVTDKEAYRLTLASLRGQIAQGNGKIDVGSYSIKAGEEYNPQYDFSFLNRKDLTIVELDEYIKHYTKICEDYDEKLTEDFKVKLAQAEKLRQTLQQDTINKKEDVK